MFFVYFIQSLKNKKVYVGKTSKEPSERLRDHNRSSNKFTRSNKPFKLIYYETYICEECARMRENFYKKGFGKEIKKLIVESLRRD